MSKRRVSLIFALAVLLFVMFFLVETVSELHPGLGFGRDVRLIVDAKESSDQLKSFLLTQRAAGHEIYVDSINDTVKMISFSGITDLQTFLNQVSSKLWKTNVLELGTFGSLSNLGQFMFTLQFYMSIFALGFSVYWTIRYKALGLFSALIIFIALLGSLLALRYLNHPFTYIVWFSMFLSFCILIFQQKALIKYISSDSFLDSSRFDRELSRRFAVHALSVIVVGAVLYYGDVSLTSAARYFLAIALFMLFGAFALPFFLKFIRQFIQDETEKRWLLVQRRYKDDYTDRILRNWGVVVISGLIAILVGGILLNTLSTRTSKMSNEYAQKTLFLIATEDAQSFIEMQASFATADVLNEEITFYISEEHSMWFFYNENVNLDNLEAARASIMDKIDVDGTIYQFTGLDSPLDSVRFYILLGISLVAGFVIASTHTKHNYGVLSLVLSLLTITICAIWFSVFTIGLSRISILLVLMIPILNSFLLISTPANMVNYSWIQRLIYVSNRLGATMMFVGLPILLIIPNPNDSILVMVSTLMIWALSTVISFCVYALIMRGDRHEKIS